MYTTTNGLAQLKQKTITFFHTVLANQIEGCVHVMIYQQQWRRACLSESNLRVYTFYGRHIKTIMTYRSAINRESPTITINLSITNALIFMFIAHKLSKYSIVNFTCAECVMILVKSF